MAVIAATNVNAISEVAITRTTLGASDTFAYTQGKTKYLVIDNVTAGAIVPNIDGDGATIAYLAGVGNVSLTSGYTFSSIAAGDAAVIDLDVISSYLKGTITVTGASGAKAHILEV